MKNKQSIIKDKNYLVIQGFMVNQHHLKGNDLLIYAIIYGFSQTENQKFTGSLQYLADWTQSTKQGVIKSLKKLITRDLIIKEEYFVNKVKFCKYSLPLLNRVKQGIKQSLMGGIKQSLPNNKELYNKEYNIKKINKRKNLNLDFIKNQDWKNLVEEWIDYKKREFNKSYKTEKTLKVFCNKLYKLSYGDFENAKAIIENSIANAYQGIFELKNKSKNLTQKNNDVLNDFINN